MKQRRIEMATQKIRVTERCRENSYRWAFTTNDKDQKYFDRKVRNIKHHYNSQWTHNGKVITPVTGEVKINELTWIVGWDDDNEEWETLQEKETRRIHT
jgi:hypothetical protein